MTKELPRAATAAIIAVAVILIGAVGYFFIGRPQNGELSDTEKKKADQTVQQQYQNFGARGAPAAGGQSPPARP